MPVARLDVLPAFLTPFRRVLLVLHERASLDELAALLVLGTWLKNEGKEPTLVVPSLEIVPKPLSPLLPIQPLMPAFRALNIRLPLEHAPLGELSYAVENDSLRLTITPKSGMWKPEMVALEAGAPRYDVLLCINIAKKSELIERLPNDPDWMHALPSVSITNEPLAEAWASLHLPCLTHASLCEEVALWMTSAKLPLPEPVAHTLLAGIIAGTNRFADPRVQSETFRLASELVALGAHQQTIIDELAQPETVPTLNLWGRALMRLTLHARLPLATVLLSEHDFLQSNTTEEDLRELPPYLLDRVPSANLVLLLYAWKGVIHARITTRNTLDTEKIARWFDGKNTHHQIEWVASENDLLSAQRTILAKLETDLPRTL